MKGKTASKKTKIDLFVIECVKERRLSLNITQADLADEFGVSPGFIGMVESPKYPTHYNIGHLNELARILNCSPQDFLPKQSL
jgi:transcriptional regulator with XRE-family HTH domain